MVIGFQRKNKRFHSFCLRIVIPITNCSVCCSNKLHLSLILFFLLNEATLAGISDCGVGEAEANRMHRTGLVQTCKHSPGPAS